MLNKITESQYDELIEARDTNQKEFIELMEEYTGIVVKPYVAYLYYDSSKKYIGSSEWASLSEILEDAGVEVIDDG